MLKERQVSDVGGGRQAPFDSFIRSLQPRRWFSGEEKKKKKKKGIEGLSGIKATTSVKVKGSDIRPPSPENVQWNEEHHMQ